MNSKHYIILIPGFRDGEYKFRKIRERLEKDFEVCMFEYDSYLNNSLITYAYELDSFLSSFSSNSKISIIGVSAGGLIANYYLKFLNINSKNKSKKNIVNLVLITVPFRGTIFAHLPLVSEGIQDMRFNSEFITKMNSRKIPPKINIKTFYSTLDIIVPFTSGKYKNNEVTLFPIHNLIHYHKPLINKIHNFLIDNK